MPNNGYVLNGFLVFKIEKYIRCKVKQKLVEFRT